MNLEVMVKEIGPALNAILTKEASRKHTKAIMQATSGAEGAGSTRAKATTSS